MSGGKLNYLSARIEDAIHNIPGDTIERIAFKEHMKKVSKALQCIEWNLSGDGSPRGSESELIRDCLESTAMLLEIIRLARDLSETLKQEIKIAETTLSSLS